MKNLSIFLIMVLAFFAVNFAFAAETEMNIYVADINQGQTANVNITLPSDARGEVLVSVNGQEYKANVVDGKATVNLTGLNAGEYKVLVTYGGNGNYSEVSKEVNLTVSDVSSQTTANASGNQVNVTYNTSANATNAAGENRTNDTNTSNNTNKTPTELVNNTTVVNQSTELVNNTTIVKQPVKHPPKQPPKSPLSELAKIPTGIPIVLLIIVIIGIVFGVKLRKK